MSRVDWRIGVSLAALFVCTGGVAYGQASPAEERLRDQLRQTTVQLRDAQDEIANLKSELEKSNALLDTQRAALATATATPKSNIGETTELRRAVEDRNQRITDAQQHLDASQKLLAQWQAAYQQAAALAKARDADAKKFEGLYGESGTRLQTCSKDNAELVNISREILEHYKKKGVWAALKDEEPLTQIHRIRFEALAQDYHAAIEDRVVPPAEAAAP